MSCIECGCVDIVCTQCGKRQDNEWKWMEDMNGKMILARVPYKTPSPIETQKLSLIQRVRGLLPRRRPPGA